MPYKVKGKCVYKKDTGKKVGCTKGSVKKYLAALHANANESKEYNEELLETLEEIIQEELEKLLNEDVAIDPRYKKEPKPKPPKPKYGPCIPPKCVPGPPGEVGWEKLPPGKRTKHGGTYREMEPGTWDIREIPPERRTKDGGTQEQVPKSRGLDEIIQEELEYILAVNNLT